ncbi:MAG: NADH:ubiquinone oxidoreductase subunit NDUFA12 [Alphaproteobacteria bacterium]|nr:NADH:ubiquinone oxidoreductase subunit NDUFA12 [Alphaproteobacteria bacterium]
MPNLWTRIFTGWHGQFVDTDSFGNRYYQERRARTGARRRRWVIYNGAAEASKVPPEWHAWLHYTIAEPPQISGVPPRDWHKPHQPNLTGTDEAYRPPGHLLAGGRRDKATGDYEPWTPN